MAQSLLKSSVPVLAVTTSLGAPGVCFMETILMFRSAPPSWPNHCPKNLLPSFLLGDRVLLCSYRLATAQAGLKLEIFLPQFPECYGYRYVPPVPVKILH